MGNWGVTTLQRTRTCRTSGLHQAPRPGRRPRRLLAEQQASVLPLIAIMLIPLMALLGGGIDMARSYLAENRIEEACDAGIYGAMKKMSAISSPGALPTDAQTIATSLFNSNFRNGDYGATGTTFSTTLDSSKTVHGTASASLPTTVMKIFGTDSMAIAADCSAVMPAVVGKNIDVMFVLESSASMGTTLSPTPRLDDVKAGIRGFYQNMAIANPNGRNRYGFVPFSANVSVGFLLKNEWMAQNWSYQTRTTDGTGAIEMKTYYANFVRKGGSFIEAVNSTYAATWDAALMNWICPQVPANHTSADTVTTVSTTTRSVPLGTETVKLMRRFVNGYKYRVARLNTTCTVYRATYMSYTEEYDEITTPVETSRGSYLYDKMSMDVSNWRSTSNGCIEERQTYFFTPDGSLPDFTQAIDLDIDRVPDSANVQTQWRPAYPNLIYQRRAMSQSDTSYSSNPNRTSVNYYNPLPISHCPAPARKLAEASASDLDAYLNTLSPAGYSYPDIGMIWGARLLSPSGIFADENADLSGKRSRRHLILIVDGPAETHVAAYGAYGSEPLDARRFSIGNPYGKTLNDIVDLRASIACQEAKKRKITVWMIAYNGTLPASYQSCAGSGRWFNASGTTGLNSALMQIAQSINIK